MVTSKRPTIISKIALNFGEIEPPVYVVTRFRVRQVYLTDLSRVMKIIIQDKNGRTALHLAATNYRFLRIRKQIETSKTEVDEAELFKGMFGYKIDLYV